MGVARRVVEGEQGDVVEDLSDEKMDSAGQ
jgi:hypothetical protein